MAQSIEKRTARGIAWRYAEEVSTKAVSFAVSVVLARLLVPDDYALVAVVTIIVGCADTFIDGGLSAAIIQKGDADEDDYATVLAFSLGVATAIYLAAFLAAPALGDLYGNGELAGIVRALCLVIVVGSVRNVYSTYIRARLQFRKLFLASLGGTLCSAVVGIALACQGFGAWALVAQQLTDCAVDTVVMRLATRFRIVPRFSAERFAELFGYSKNLLATSVVAQACNALTPLIVSLRYSMVDLAYYTKAKGLSGYMLGFVETPLSQVLFPALSQIKDDRQKLLGLLRKFYRALYLFTLPALFGLYAVADDLVLLLLTEKWLPIVPLRLAVKVVAGVAVYAVLGLVRHALAPR